MSGKIGRACQWIAGWIPVVFTTGIVAYGYYVYVVEFCILNLLGRDPPSTVQAVFYLIVSNLFGLLFIIYYYIAIFKSPGSPLNHRIEICNTEHPEESQNLSTSNREPFFLKTERQCGICKTVKPDRCHHCSVCDCCVLKMDHHCPWFNNCIGYCNYKAFILSLIWAFLLSSWVFGTLLGELIAQLVNGTTDGTSVQFLVICVFGFVFMVSAGFLGGYHLYLISKNLTTIEHIEQGERHLQRTKNKFNLGCIKNYRQVFGRMPWQWIAPWPPKDNGCHQGILFPKNPSISLLSQTDVIV